ncbi:WXG100 family type VII secretion target [Flexivirga caeni]|nr:hypothetical protein [Flexivirga caeni]
MDDDVVEGVARQMRQIADQLQTIAASVEGEISRVSGVWFGDAPVQMLADWRTQHGPGLRAAAGSVTTLVGRLDQNVAAQRVTSATYAGSTSSSGVAGGGGGGGGGGRWISDMVHIPPWVSSQFKDGLMDPAGLGEGLEEWAKRLAHFEIRGSDGKFIKFTGNSLEKIFARNSLENFVANPGNAEVFKTLKWGSTAIRFGGYAASAASIGVDLYFGYQENSGLPVVDRSAYAVVNALPDIGATAGGIIGTAIPVPIVGSVVGGVVGYGIGEVLKYSAENAPELIDAATGVAESAAAGIDNFSWSVSQFLGSLRW